MSTIFELKKQIYSEISDITYNIFMNNIEKDYFCKVTKKINNYINKQDNINTEVDISLTINHIKLEQCDVKNYFYCINFELVLSINTKFSEHKEVSVYNIIENILKLLSTMEFYYCYKLNNQNIKSTIMPQSTEKYIIKVEWITNLHTNNNLFH